MHNTAIQQKALLVTVVTIVKNAPGDLERTLRSVSEQTYAPLEHIIVDGGSTDETIQIIRKHEKHITRWISEPDKGIYDAMNKGIRMARGI